MLLPAVQLMFFDNKCVEYEVILVIVLLLLSGMTWAEIR